MEHIDLKNKKNHFYVGKTVNEEDYLNGSIPYSMGDSLSSKWLLGFSHKHRIRMV